MRIARGCLIVAMVFSIFASSARAAPGQPSAGKVEVSPAPAQPGVPGDAGLLLVVEEIVLHRLRGVYMGGIKRCYKRYLRTHKDAEGEIRLSFKVNLKGRVEDGDAAGFAEDIDHCVEALMTSWRFRIPKEEFKDLQPYPIAVRLLLIP
jgi:hypothetical protein